MVAIKIMPGRTFDIYALEYNGRREFLDFLIDLKASSEAEFARFVRVLDWTADVGLLRNPQKFKRLTVDIYEFKTSGGNRALCFRDGKSMVVLTNGFKKKKNYADDIKRAELLRSQYLNAKSNGCLRYTEEDVL